MIYKTYWNILHKPYGLLLKWFVLKKKNLIVHTLLNAKYNFEEF